MMKPDLNLNYLKFKTVETSSVFLLQLKLLQEEMKFYVSSLVVDLDDPSSKATLVDAVQNHALVKARVRLDT